MRRKGCRQQPIRTGHMLAVAGPPANQRGRLPGTAANQKAEPCPGIPVARGGALPWHPRCQGAQLLWEGFPWDCRCQGAWLATRLPWQQHGWGGCQGGCQGNARAVAGASPWQRRGIPGDDDSPVAKAMPSRLSRHRRDNAGGGGGGAVAMATPQRLLGQRRDNARTWLG